MRAVTHRGSSLLLVVGPGPHGTWRAMPAFPQPTGAPDTACRQRRPASPRRCVGCAPYSRVRRQPHGLKDCHTLCPDTGVGVPPRTMASRVASNSLARARLLPQPQCSRGRPLHPQGDCAWYHLATVRRVGPNQVPPKRALPMAPSAACHSQSTPSNSSHPSTRAPHIRCKTPVPTHR